jgi:hypothetical protein
MFSVADPGCLSRIPDPTFFHPGSRIRTVSIPDPGSSSKNLSILTPKKDKKWFLSSKKYDPGCSSRIPDPDADFLPSRISDPGVKKAPNPGSGSATLITGMLILMFIFLCRPDPRPSGPAARLRCEAEHAPSAQLRSGLLHSSQCCGSGMFIPDPDFCPFPHPRKKLVVLPFL